jgi:hypothetical protein
MLNSLLKNLAITLLHIFIGGVFKMRRIYVLAIVVLFLIAGGSARALKPTGEYPKDVQNVQRAVDQGGTVMLEAGKFNFGDQEGKEGSVLIGRKGKDVVIEGQGLATEIYGGYRAFVTATAEAVNFTIDNIYFNSPKSSAIEISNAKKAEIKNNNIYNVRTGAPEMYLPAKGRYAIYVGETGPCVTYNGTIESVVIQNNEITNFTSSASEYNFYSSGIHILNIEKEEDITKNITVEANTIKNPGHAGIMIVGTSGVTISVKENKIYQRHTSFYEFSGGPNDLYPLRAGRGIQVFSAEAYGGECGPVIIEDNLISDISTKGIAIQDVKEADVDLRGNVIAMSDALSGSTGIYVGALYSELAGLYHGSASVEAESNQIKGKATYGIVIDSGSGSSHHNTIKSSDLNGLDAKWHLFLDRDSHDNVVENSEGWKVKDLGKDNVIK